MSNKTFTIRIHSGQDLNFEIISEEDKTVCITGADSPVWDLVIPKSVTFNGKEYLVTSIGDYAFCECNDLASVTIPDSVISIGNYAFSNCIRLTSVTIPDSVTEIGDFAFCNCIGLTSVIIPDSVTSIGNDAFYCVRNIIYHGTAGGSPCGALTVNGYEEGDLFYSDDTKTHLTGCRGTATTVTIPNSVQYIGNGAFAFCYALTSVTIPNSVTAIENSAFYLCSGLTSINIPNSVTSIGEWTFHGCSGLIKMLQIGKYYKGFKPGLVCRDYHFQEGVVNELKDKENEISLYKRGFHFCDNPLSVFDHYHGSDREDMELWEVEPMGEIIHGDDHKHCCSKLRPVRRIPFSEIGKIVAEAIELEEKRK